MIIRYYLCLIVFSFCVHAFYSFHPVLVPLWGNALWALFFAGVLFVLVLGKSMSRRGVCGVLGGGLLLL